MRRPVLACALALALLPAALFGWNTQDRIVHQVDHVLFATPAGPALVTLLTDRLSLPLIWPQPGDEWTATTGIGLGNVTLEVFPRPPAPAGEAPVPARINSLALQPTGLDAALRELQARGIDHVRSEPAARWINVPLRGFGHGLFLIQYVFDMDERRARFDRVLRERDGGPLGILRVREVAIEVDSVAPVRPLWTKLLGSPVSGDSDVWAAGDGPRIRLVNPGDPRAGQLIVEVKSLSRATDALRRLGIGAEAAGREIRIAPAAASGLRLVLRE